MLIAVVDDGLEELLRAALPLPVDQGDVSFEAPSSTWSAQVSRLTVNLFLFSVSRSTQPPRPPVVRPRADGSLERRFALPMVELSYLVSAWAGSPRDEHSLLGDVLTRLSAHQVLPPEHLPRTLSSPIQLTLATDDPTRQRELWSGLGGAPKASFTLVTTLAVDAYDWEPTPPRVTEIVSPVTHLRDERAGAPA